jgi:arylsulfatase A-like enzyme
MPNINNTSRRDFLKLAGAGAAGILFPVLFGCEQQSFQRSNVVLILCDDMGFSDLGCFGSEIHTPNLDNLAANGLRMTQFYNAARCCPTRASLLTGLYPHQAGVGEMDSDLGTPAYQGFLNDNCVTIAEVLKDAGYNTYMSGKWHVGRKKGQWPLDRGFDRYYGLINGASNYFNNIFFGDPSKNQTFLLDDKRIDNPATTEEMWLKNEGFYLTDAFTDYALEFLDQHQHTDNPFFLYLAYTTPHWPLHAFPEDIEKYTGKFKIGWDKLREKRLQKQIELGLFSSFQRLATRTPEIPAWEEAGNDMRDEFEKEMTIYAAMIDRMDKNIGRLTGKLKQMGQFENTLIIFLSDNGGCHTTPEFEHLNGTPGGPNSFPCYGFMGANVSNTPFRKYKQFIHEGGIATPFIAHFPKLIRPGQICDQPGHIIDIMPTLVDFCEADYPTVRNSKPIKKMQGISLRPLFEQKKIQRNAPLFWEHVENRGVRSGDWKLVAAKPDMKWELYFIKEDRTELYDLTSKYPEKLQELLKYYEEWADLNHVKL